MSLWTEEYFCTPYIEPKVGLHYIMQYCRATQPVLILGIFNELIVVRHDGPPRKYQDAELVEEAVVRRYASFIEIPPLGSEVASATDTDAEPE